MELRRQLKPEYVTAIIDTREQRPLDLFPLKTIRATLQSGDYQIQGLSPASGIVIERKSLPDLLQCVGRERERFSRELERLLAFRTRYLVIESTWQQCESGLWLTQGKSQVHPNSVIGSLLGWMEMGIPVLMAGDHERAGRFVARLIFTAARRRWAELMALSDAVSDEKTSEDEFTRQPAAISVG